MPKKILVIEDEESIRNIIRVFLEDAGYTVFVAGDGLEGVNKFHEKSPDLVLLDLMLPGLNGEELLPRIKDIPVIVVSAKTAVESKVSLLLNGACDYLTKPFHTDELLARIKVQLRAQEKRPEEALATVFTFQELELHTGTHTVLANGKETRLTRTEYAILKLLIQNPSQVIPKSLLLDRISDDTPDCTESSLKIHISNLRKKLRALTGKDYIEAVWGIGFKIRTE